MFKILIIEATSVFREFLKDKFKEENIEVCYCEDKRDAVTKMVSILPDLIILNIRDNFSEPELFEFLHKKQTDVNGSRLPMIACGPTIDKEMQARLSQYKIIKYFEKPIKFDIFFEFVGRILKVAFTMDITPCVLDLHRNNNLIFIEIAYGLNREKLALLKYRLAELIDSIGITEPKIVIMLSNLELTFVDGLNLELLFDNVLAHPNVLTKNVKVLSFSKFVSDLVEGHPRYHGMEVTKELQNVLNSLVETSSSASVPDLISDKVLAFNERTGENSVELKFYSDSAIINQTVESKTKVAVVDDDSVILKIVKNSLELNSISCDAFTSGSDFLPKASQMNYKVVILDIMMPGISGFDILRKLKSISSSAKIIIYSNASKEMAVQALSLGANYYMPKPQKTEILVAKVKEFLN